VHRGSDLPQPVCDLLIDGTVECRREATGDLEQVARVVRKDPGRDRALIAGRADSAHIERHRKELLRTQAHCAKWRGQARPEILRKVVVGEVSDRQRDRIGKRLGR